MAPGAEFTVFINFQPLYFCCNIFDPYGSLARGYFGYVVEVMMPKYIKSDVK